MSDKDDKNEPYEKGFEMSYTLWNLGVQHYEEVERDGETVYRYAYNLPEGFRVKTIRDEKRGIECETYDVIKPPENHD